jgi:transcriptional regulator
MYSPASFQNTNLDEAVAFMQLHSFATLVSTDGEQIFATQLPFFLVKEDSQLTLFSHLAAANPQAHFIENRNCKVLFQGPHAYISPSLYAHAKNVPTWNYQTLQVTGVGQVQTTDEELETSMDKLFDAHDSAFKSQWQTLDPVYKRILKKEVVMFKIEVSSWVFTEKLSQNKTEAEQQKIAESLIAAGNALGEVILEKLGRK